MKEFVNLLWRPLILDMDVFVAQRKSPDAFKRAFLVVVIVGLFVGLFAGGLTAGSALLAPEPTMKAEMEATKQALSWLDNMPSDTMPREARQMIEQYTLASIHIGFGVQRAVQADQGKFVIDQILGALALWITSPIGLLAAIIPFTLLVLLVARLLGGNASLSGMLGCTLLAVTPHLLDPIGVVLGAIPCCGGCLGGILGLVTFVWSIVIYCVAVAVANSFSYVKSVAAMVISLLIAILGPMLVAVVLVIIGILLSSIISATS